MRTEKYRTLKEEREEMREGEGEREQGERGGLYRTYIVFCLLKSCEYLDKLLVKIKAMFIVLKEGPLELACEGSLSIQGPFHFLGNVIRMSGQGLWVQSGTKRDKFQLSRTVVKKFSWLPFCSQGQVSVRHTPCHW